MPAHPAAAPLRKVTLNLFDTDVAWFQKRFGHGYSEHVRDILHRHVRSQQPTDEPNYPEAFATQEDLDET